MSVTTLSLLTPSLVLRFSETFLHSYIIGESKIKDLLITIIFLTLSSFFIRCISSLLPLNLQRYEICSKLSRQVSKSLPLCFKSILLHNNTPKLHLSFIHILSISERMTILHFIDPQIAELFKIMLTALKTQHFV